MRKILIANRGEIAVRIVRACADAGLASVAVYADPDADALHVRLADEAYALGGTSAAETYLDIAELLAVAAPVRRRRRPPRLRVPLRERRLRPGGDRRRAHLDRPLPGDDRALGNKVTAREIARRGRRPAGPGHRRPGRRRRRRSAPSPQEHGLPVVVKAAFGGGGRGMRVVQELDEVEDAFDSAVREAAVRVRPRRVLRRAVPGPARGTSRRRSWPTPTATSSWSGPGTAPCSAATRSSSRRPPRRSSPTSSASGSPTRPRASAGRPATSAPAPSSSSSRPDGLISFLEVNTRLQVEHPVTEETYGVDLVRAQLRIAAGLPLSVTRDPGTRAGTRSSSGSTPRTPAAASCPLRARSRPFDPRPAPGSASTPGCAPDPGGPAGSTRCWPSSSSTARTAPQALARARTALRRAAHRGRAHRGPVPPRRGGAPRFHPPGRGARASTPRGSSPSSPDASPRTPSGPPDVPRRDPLHRRP